MFNEAYYKPYDIVVPKDIEEPEFKRIPPAGVESIKAAAIENDLVYMKHRVVELEHRAHDFVSPEELEPIRKLVFGLVTTILVAIIGALLSLTISA